MWTAVISSGPDYAALVSKNVEVLPAGFDTFTLKAV